MSYCCYLFCAVYLKYLTVALHVLFICPVYRYHEQGMSMNGKWRLPPMTKEHTRTQSESQEIDFEVIYMADKYIIQSSH